VCCSQSARSCKAACGESHRSHLIAGQFWHRRCLGCLQIPTSSGRNQTVCRCDRSQVSRYSKYGFGFATGRRVHRCPRRQQTQFEAGDSDSNSRCRPQGRQVRSSVGLCGGSGFCSETVTRVCRSLSSSHTHGRSCKRRCQRPGQPPGCRAPLGLPRPQLRGPWRGRHSR
jgi:hypothetical protein